MKRYPILSFCLLGMAISWACWVPLVLAARGIFNLPFSPNQVHFCGAYGPALAALVIALVCGGREGGRNLLSRFGQWRVPVQWYLAALLLPAGISFLTTAINMMMGGSVPDYTSPPIFNAVLPQSYSAWPGWALAFPIFLQYLLFGTSIGEELAWRGFATTRLQERFGPLKTSVMVGILWVIWGLPLSTVQAAPQWLVLHLGVLLAGAIPAAILSTWLYNRTQGSLLLVLLFNTAVKMTDLFITPSAASPVVPALAYWLVALFLLGVFGPEVLQPSPVPLVQQKTESAQEEPARLA